MKKNILDQIQQTIDNAKRLLITAHIDPDGDSIGSQLALADYLLLSAKQVRVINQGKMPGKYKFLDRHNRLEVYHPKIRFNPETVVVVECPSFERIGGVKSLIAPGTPIINVDHHPENQRFGTLNWIETRAAAVGEMIYQFLQKVEHRITDEVATLLFTAILTDTGRFRYGSTTSRTLKICADLIGNGADPKFITDQVYFNHLPENLRLIGHVVERMELKVNGRVCAITIRKADLKKFKAKFEDTEGIVDYTLLSAGVEIGILFKEIEAGKTKVSLRSQDSIDISQVARLFGGGGHTNAAGCSLLLPLPEAKKIIFEKVQEFLRNGARWNSLD